MTKFQGTNGEWTLGEQGQGTSHFYIDPSTGARYVHLWDAIYAVAYESSRDSGDDEEAAEEFATVEADYVTAQVS